MRHLNRLPTPNILIKKQVEWTDKFVSSSSKRPDNSKYAHKDILTDLCSISYHKCYYCEQKIKGIAQEIDHYIEVIEDKKLAFDWNNLYLSCSNCNNKISN